MKSSNPWRKRLHRARRSLPLALAGTLVAAGAAVAISAGVQNSSFEAGLDHWTTEAYKGSGATRTTVYGPGGTKGTAVPGCDAPDPYNICVTGPDTFEVQDGDGTRNLTVSPLDGDKMLRIFGPFHDDGENQIDGHKLAAQQQFTVNGSDPVLQMNYNLFTFDYSGFDELRVAVKVFDDSGSLVAGTTQGGFGPSGDTDLKTTGWRGIPMDLSAYAGQQMLVKVEIEGTSDELYGTWGYFDAGEPPPPPVDAEGSAGSAPSGVDVDKYIGSSGLPEFQIENSDLNQYLSQNPSADCVPFTVTLPINGTSVLSNVTLSFTDQVETMTNVGGRTYSAELCLEPFEDGDLKLEYDASENCPGPECVTQHFSVVVGSIILIDPQGIVHDLQTFQQLKAQGQTDEQARNGAAIQGATATLQRCNTAAGGCTNVLSSDPGISPNVNPQTTGADGKYQWDVSEAFYRVVVVKAGYNPVTSEIVYIPPPKLDLHIGMNRVGSENTGGGGGATPATPPAQPKKCKKGQKLKKGKCVKAKKKKKKK